MKVTSAVFDAHLKCPTRCWLQATGEPFFGNAYAHWLKTQGDYYSATMIETLVAQSSNEEITVSTSATDILAARWRFAFGLTVQVITESFVLESAHQAT